MGNLNSRTFSFTVKMVNVEEKIFLARVAE